MQKAIGFASLNPLFGHGWGMGGNKKNAPTGTGAEQEKMKKIFVRLLDDEGLDVHQCGASRQAQLVP